MELERASPLLAMALQAGLLNTPVNPSTRFFFTFGEYVQIPVGSMMAESQRTAVAAQMQLDRDVQSIRDYNDSFRELNDRVLPILHDVSGQDLGAKKQDWQNWFTRSDRLPVAACQAVGTRYAG